MNKDEKSSIDEIGNDYFTVKTTTTIIKKHRYDVYILNNITAAHEYVDLFDLLAHATKSDEIHLYINSGGGYCRTAIQMINAMRNCDAHITCYASGAVASAATWLFLSGDSFVMEDDIMFMVHYFSKGMHGKGNELEANAEFTKYFYRQFYKKMYRHFMTEEEISKTIEGKDYYFNQKQVAKRLKNRLSLLKAESQPKPKVEK